MTKVNNLSHIRMSIDNARGSIHTPSDSRVYFTSTSYGRYIVSLTIPQHASAFMIDLGQISQALRGATRHSLIIMDEFGKGMLGNLAY